MDLPAVIIDSPDAPIGVDDAFDMDVVIDVLRSMDVVASVEMTGGGVATIYAGTPYANPNPDEDWTLSPAIAGPGYYGRGTDPSYAFLSDFWVGPDNEDVFPTDASEAGCRTIRDIARLIVAQVNASQGNLSS